MLDYIDPSICHVADYYICMLFKDKSIETNKHTNNEICPKNDTVILSSQEIDKKIVISNSTTFPAFHDVQTRLSDLADVQF